MSVQKDLNKFGVGLGIEATGYGAGGTIAPATDGHLVYEDPEVTRTPQQDGSRAGKVATGYASLQNVAASGFKNEWDMAMYWRGPGAAYTTTSIYSTIHRVLLLLGMTGTNDATKWTYAFTSDNFSTGFAEVYVRRQKYVAAGVYCKQLVVTAKGKETPQFKASLVGIETAKPVDAAVPAFTYPYLTKASPKAAKIALTLTDGAGGAFAGRVQDFTLTLTRDVAERENQQDANGNHGGFALGLYHAKLDATIEATSLVTASPYTQTTQLNPYQLYDNGTPLALAFTVGSAVGLRWKATSSTAQLTASPKEDKNGTVALWGLSLECKPANDASEADFTFVTD